MITKFLQYIKEASSLTQIGVPNEVMRKIQKDYQIDENSSWTEFRRKSDVKDELEKNQNSLFIQVDTTNKIKVFCAIYKAEHKSYILDEYVLDYKQEWGGSWNKKDRESLTLNGLMDYISVRHTPTYRLDGDDFEILSHSVRKSIEVQKEFRDITEKFKEYVITNFSGIIRRMFGRRNEEDVKDTIISNVSQINSSMSLEEIKRILLGETQRTPAPVQEDPLHIKDTRIKDNSLTVLDEYLMSFEDACSEEDEMVFIEELIEKHTFEKVVRAFVYYMYSGEIRFL